ncbi:LOW QUALITY PROTEIN: RING finger protein 32 [Fundulus diaphanus]
MLAQKLGLVAAAWERLTEYEWTQVKTRSSFSASSLVFTAHVFSALCWVLLSCTPVFHRTWLQASERFSGRKHCPMCRNVVIHDAARLFRHHCATRSDSCLHSSEHAGCVRRLRLQELNDSFVRYCHTDTEAFLSDIDRSLSSSRRVFVELERKGISEPQENEWVRPRSQVIQRGTDICLTAACEPEQSDPGINKFDTPCSCHIPTCSISLV